MGCLVQVGNGIELEAVGFQFEPYWWLPCGVTWDSSQVLNSRGNKAAANLSKVLQSRIMMYLAWPQNFTEAIWKWKSMTLSMINNRFKKAHFGHSQSIFFLWNENKSVAQWLSVSKDSKCCHTSLNPAGCWSSLQPLWTDSVWHMLICIAVQGLFVYTLPWSWPVAILHWTAGRV